MNDFETEFSSRAIDASARGNRSGRWNKEKACSEKRARTRKSWRRSTRTNTRITPRRSRPPHAFTGRPGPIVASAAMRYADHQGASALGEYFAVKSGMFPGMSSEARAAVKVVFRDGKIEVVLELTPDLPREPLFHGAGVELAVADLIGPSTPSSLFYIEDKAILSKLDGTLAPGPSLSEAARNPRVVWTKFTAKGLGTYQPLKVRVGDKVYTPGRGDASRFD